MEKDHSGLGGQYGQGYGSDARVKARYGEGKLHWGK